MTMDQLQAVVEEQGDRPQGVSRSTAVPAPAGAHARAAWQPPKGAPRQTTFASTPGKAPLAAKEDVEEEGVGMRVGGLLTVDDLGEVAAMADDLLAGLTLVSGPQCTGGG